MNSEIKSKFKDILSSKRITRVGGNLLPYTIVVLTYHDLCEGGNFSSWLRVNKDVFELQMGQLNEICNFIHPSDLFQKDTLSKDRLNALITFDDGFMNQYTLALPVLRKFKIPALFFISTENIESGDIFWFDRIVIPIQALRINTLDLQPLGLRNYHFFAWDGAKRWDDIQVLLEDIKSKGNDSSPNVKQILKYFDDAFREVNKRIMHSYHPLTQDKVYEMRSSKLCYFGSHSHRHEILTYLNDNEIRTNLIKSKEFLEKSLGERITHFAYPNGNTNTRVIELCREAGYEYGYMTKSGLLNHHKPSMNIARFAVTCFSSFQPLFGKTNEEGLRAIIKWKY